MQNTRLNTLVEVNLGRLSRWASNPWRRRSLGIISWLLGFYLASAISTVWGAKSFVDILSSALVLLFTEVVSQLTYSSKRPVLPDGSLAPRSLTISLLNLLKMGVAYGLYLDAFKLGS